MRLFLSWAHCDVDFLSFCRLQQDIQSISGQRTATTESQTAPSTLHPHRSLHTQTCNAVLHTHIRVLINSVCEKATHAAPTCAFKTQTHKHKWEVCILIQGITFLVCLQHANIYPDSDAVLFLYVGYYILVYLQDYFLHCINTRQQEMLCHSLYLSGKMGLIQIVSKLSNVFLSYDTCSYFLVIHSFYQTWHLNKCRECGPHIYLIFNRVEIYWAYHRHISLCLLWKLFWGHEIW